MGEDSGGTVTYTKVKPLSVKYGLSENFDSEGRIITLEFQNFYLVNVYVPNSKSSIIRVDYRMKWDELFFKYIMNLESNKPVIMCGDFNVDYNSINENYIENTFMNNEKEEFEHLLNYGYIDSFHYLHPNQKNCYTWWNVGKENKEKKLGYRLDYFLISKFLLNKLINSNIHNDINDSDHCPISLSIDIKERE